MLSGNSAEKTARTGGPAWVARAALALFLSLVLWEVLLRAFVTIPIMSHHVEGLGWLPVAHRTGLWTVEGRARCTYNSYGFRDTEVEPRKPGERRILVLGDSLVEGRQIAQSETFPARLQELLNAGSPAGPSAPGAPSGAPPIVSTRVFNAGRNGVGLPAHLAYADRYKAVFEPDWVVILIGDGRRDTIFSKTQEAYYIPSGEGFEIVNRWTRDRLPRSFHLRRRLHINDLSLYDWTYRRVTMLKRASAKGAPAAGAEMDDEAAAKADRSNADGKPSGVESAMGWDRILRWTLPELKRAYPKLVIVHLPAHSSETMGLRPLQPEESLMMRYCRAEGIPLIRMRDPIPNDYARTGIPSFGFANTLPWSGHTNAHGHALIAKELEAFFRSGAGAIDSSNGVAEASAKAPVKAVANIGAGERSARPAATAAAVQP